MIRFRLIAAAATVVVLGSAVLLAAPAAAQAPGNPASAVDPALEKDARAFADALTSELRAIAQAEALTPKQRDAQLRAVLSKHLAMRSLSSFLIGQNLQKANATQQAQYNDLFPTYITALFANRIGDLVGRDLDFSAVQTRGRDALVRSSFKRKRDGSVIDVNWRVRRQSDQSLRLVDVQVRGVSPLVAQAEALTPKQRDAQLRAVLSKHLAMRSLSSFLIGQNLQKANATQQAQYNDLFPTYITALFANRIGDLVGRDLDFSAVQTRGRDALVRSSFKRKRDGSVIDVNWRVRRQSDQSLRLVDVQVRGVSPLVAQRDEFNAIVASQGFDALLAAMQAKIDQ